MEHEIVKTYYNSAKTIKLEISQDECADSPREWDNLGTMACWHRRYNLGDEYATEEFDTDLYGTFKELITDNFGESDIVLPLYLYDHGGISISTGPFSCNWDSGAVGFIYARADKIRKEYNCKRITKKIREKVLEQLEAEVDLYDDYLQNEVYSFIKYEKKATCKSCGSFEWVEVDSCGGYIGSNIDELFAEEIQALNTNNVEKI